MAVVSYELAASGEAVSVGGVWYGDIDVEALTGGGFAVAWRADSDPYEGTAQIWVRAYNPDMIGAGDAYQFSDGPYQPHQDQRLADLAALSDGGFAVAFLDIAYFRNTGSSSHAHALRGGTFTATGAPATEFVASYTSGTSNITDPGHFVWSGGDITAMADGGFATVWDTLYSTNGGPTTQRVFTDVRDAAGGVLADDVWTTPEVEKAGSTQTAGLTNGAQVIAWKVSYNTGDSDLFGRIRDANGVLGAVFQITPSDAPGSNSLSTTSDQLIALTDGGFVVVWQHWNRTTSAYTIYAQRYDASGVSQGISVVANERSDDIDVTATPDGGYLVAWNGSGGVHLRQSDPAGGWAESGVLPPAAAAAGGGVTMLADGRLVAAWESAGVGYAQAFNRVRVLTGDDLSESLVGTTANETIRGLGGDDSINGGQGADRMEGGAGNDSYRVDNVADEVVELAGEGLDRVYASVDYTLAVNIERLSLLGTAVRATGNAGDNWLTGNAGANVLDGGAGADRLAGGAGSYTYYVDSAGDVVVESLGQGYDRVFASVDHTLNTAVDRLTLTGGAVRGTGNASDNLLEGNALANTLDGKGGVDRLVGGAGDDSYYVDNVGDRVVEAAAEGLDRVYASVDYALAANVERLSLLGTAVRATGNTGDNWLTGNAAANVLDGKAGADRMAGAAGSDVYYVDNPGDVVVEFAGQGFDWVLASVDHTLNTAVERLTLKGSAVRGTGNGSDNLLEGNALANVLVGGGGADRLVGGLGADILTGGTGADTFRFNALGDSAVDAPDRITAWEKGVDRIDLSGIDARLAESGDQGFTVVNAFSGAAGEAVLTYDAAAGTTTLQLDQNGDTVADFALVIVGQLTAADTTGWLL